ncbi:MAG TPA: DUF3048 domain-containing protein [Acidimicrobiales bacterium]|nr:DUF3048 domain-containing protein [Acidimicrobiales bacterium]
MPDDTIPDGTGDTTDEPGLAETPPAGTPSVTSEEPGGAAGADDTTAVVSTTAVAAESEAGGTDSSGDTTASGGGPRHAKRSGMNRTWVIAAVAAVVVLAGAGIALGVTSGKKANKAPRSHPSAATMIPAPSGPDCPLTGQPAPGGQVPQRPALAFKVDNYPTARPQSGLNDADIVFEEVVEGGITRFVAVFQCQEAPLVGPIRSARAVDVPILDQLSKPLFVHAGGINPVIALVNGGNLINDDVFTHASIVQHPSGRYAPYDTYASTSAAWGLNPSDTTPPSPLFTYSSTVPTGTPVGTVSIAFSGTNDNTWTWSPLNGAWLLSISGAPENVANGTRVGVANIVVETVHVTLGPWLENSEGGLEVQSQLTGSGPLQVFRNSEKITGTWQRSALSNTTSLVAADGSTIALDPGKTWVELVPTYIPVTTAAPVAGTP